MEVCHLLLFGELPNRGQKDKFVWDITHHTMVHDQINNFFRGFRRDAHPMAVVCGVVGALSAFYHDSTDINDPWPRKVASYRLIPKLPTTPPRPYKYSTGQPFVLPVHNPNYPSTFLPIYSPLPPA